MRGHRWRLLCLVVLAKHSGATNLLFENATATSLYEKVMSALLRHIYIYMYAHY